MEDNKPDQVNEQDQVTPEDQANQQDQQSQTLEKKILEMEERYKAQIKGLDQKVSKITKEKETLELEKMTESERAEAERVKAIEETTSIKAETVKLRRERDLTKVLFDKNLDPTLFESRITGETIEEMMADAEKLQIAIEKAVELKLEKEITVRLGGRQPEGGANSTSLTSEEQVERARRISSGR